MWKVAVFRKEQTAEIKAYFCLFVCMFVSEKAADKAILCRSTCAMFRNLDFYSIATGKPLKLCLCHKHNNDQTSTL